uniref:MoaD/ThiS family protein n=1 Tax=Ignisphaera aggregans TaxID=334771 RepID=A0A7C2ZVH4_9CREN
MRILVEFAWAVAEKVGKKYMWVSLDGEELRIEDLFLKVLAKEAGKEIGEVLYKLFIDREILVIVNGVIAVDPGTKLKDGDKVLIQPVASGG